MNVTFEEVSTPFIGVGRQSKLLASGITQQPETTSQTTRTAPTFGKGQANLNEPTFLQNTHHLAVSHAH